MLEIVILLLIFSGTLMAVLAIIALQRRSSSMTISFAVCCICAGIWNFAFAAEILSPTLAVKVFWADIQFLGISFLPVAWLGMIMYATAQPRQVLRAIPFLGFIPIVTNVIIWTDKYHHLFRMDPWINTTGVPFPVLIGNYQIFFYAVHVPYSYLLFAASLILLVYDWRKTPVIYRVQRITLFISSLLPLLVDVLYVTGSNLLPAFNFTSIVFSFSGLLLAINVFSWRFLDVVPLAYEAAINEMKVGVIVLDSHYHVSYLNPAAEKITGFMNAQAIGKNGKQMFHYLESLWISPDGNAEVVFGTGADETTYQLHRAEIQESRKRLVGYVITMNDITERVRLYKQVEELSLTDPLTSALNRRGLNLYGEKEIVTALRYKRKLSLLMLDVDNFKEINDRFGHQFGDELLRGMVRTIQEVMRESDLLFRYGGDEFVLLLLETGAEGAQRISKRICQKLTHLALENDHALPEGVLISLGITSLAVDDSLETMLARADQALYQAKTAGKNQIVVR